MKKRILAVDDENVILHLLTRFFKKSEQYELVTCGGVRDAFQKMDEADIDLLITDLRLADGVGTDVAKHYKKKFPNGKVIVMTGLLTPDEYLRDIKDVMEYQLIFKPFDLAVIGALIEKAFQKA